MQKASLVAALDGLAAATAAGAFASSALVEATNLPHPFGNVLLPASVVLGFSATRALRAALRRSASLGTPIVCASTATAVLVAASQWPMHAVTLLLASASIALALARTALSFRENARLLAASRREALIDPLTGLGNRRKLLADLDAEIDAARAGSPRVLVLFDLNGFKTYNDTFGHPAGDALLARLGQRLASAVAPAGEAYRMGGDEFCVLLPESDPDLRPMAEALCERGEGFDVSSAYGAALIPAEVTAVSTALSLADQRLYAHKERPAGRLRLVAN